MPVLVGYYLRAQKISSTFLKNISAKFKKSKQRNSEGYKIGVFTGYNLEGLLFSKLFSSKPEKNSQLNIRRVAGFSRSRWLPIEGIIIFSKSC
ncbi:MAG: hypothetical protein J6M12_04255, partial [Clostridia bacterium]|nr:hypothetical protein [Clostridia bacterium]